jgi:tetratricopeptide (TPR) repeat protein
MNPTLKNLSCLLLAAAFITQTGKAQNVEITTAEAEKLSIQLDTSLSNGNPDILNQLISFPDFISRMHSRSRIINNFDTLTKIATQFGLFSIGNGTAEMAKNGGYHLLRGYRKNDEVHLLFRVFGEGGLDYQDITLVKVKDSIKAADILSYELGESYTTLFAAAIADNDPGDFHSSLTTREKYSGIFANAIRNKNYSVAKSAFEKFDEQTQNERHFLLQYLQVCKQIDQKAYKKALDRYASLFPDEPTSYLMMMQVYAGTKEYDHNIMAVDKLDTLLSTDPFLNYFRGNIAMKMGSRREARDFYQLAFDYDPSIWQNTKSLVACNVMSNELVQAGDVINRYKRSPGFRKALVESLYTDYPVLK